MNIRISGLAAATPDKWIDSRQYAEFATRISARVPREEALIHAVTRQSGIRKRHSVVIHVNSPDRFAFYDAENWPGTAARMQMYAQHAPLLAERAARGALEATGVNANNITHLVTASCTGFFAPGIDYELIRRLGLSNNIGRMHLGFMGCHAAINVLSTAKAIALSSPNAVVLCVCVELCTLHFQRGMGRDVVVPNTLFGDGAAAFVVRADAGEGPELIATHSRLFPDSGEAMTWKVTDSGFRMTLDASVPELIQREVRGFVESAIAGEGLGLRDIAGWAIHPGGPRIVESVLRALCLPAEMGDASRAVLSEYGNMSSPTVLFILRELVERNVKGPVVMLAFGPGLVAEMALLRI